MQTWYQTRYCLTQGIKEIHDWTYSKSSFRIRHGLLGCNYDLVGVDIFATIEEAREDQKNRARKAIAAAEKRIEKLKELL